MCAIFSTPASAAHPDGWLCSPQDAPSDPPLAPRHRDLRARLRSARIRLDDLALAIERCRSSTPFDRVFAGVKATVGDQLGPDAVLPRCYSIRALEVRARVPAPNQAEIATTSLSPNAASTPTPGL